MSAALAEPEAPTETSWRDPHIETLRFSRRIESRLRAFKIETIGNLADALDNGDTFDLPPGEVAKLQLAIDSIDKETVIETDFEKVLSDESDADESNAVEADPIEHLRNMRAEAKQAYPELIVLMEFESGYVLFDDDAEAAKPILEPILAFDFTLHIGDDSSGRIPKPDLDVALRALLAAGLRVAVCDTDGKPTAAPTEPMPAAAGAEPPATPPTATATQQPEEGNAYELETNRLVLEASLRVNSFEAVFERLKASAKEAKDDYEASVVEMRNLIKRREEAKHSTKGTLFDKRPDADDEPAAAPKGQPSGDYGELWQRFPMTFERWERFGLTAKDIERLNSGETKNNGVCPILVFGDVSRFITPNPDNPSFTRTLKDFKGFGDKGMDRYSDAELAFWKWWNGAGAAEFAAEQGVKPNADSETVPGVGSEDPQPSGETADGDPLDSTRIDADRTAEQPETADDSRPLGELDQEAHPDIVPVKPRKRKAKVK